MTKRAEEQALKLRGTDKTRLIDRLLASLDQPDNAIDKLWEKEAEARIAAHGAGKIKTVSLAEVLEKYRAVF